MRRGARFFLEIGPTESPELTRLYREDAHRGGHRVRLARRDRAHLDPALPAPSITARVLHVPPGDQAVVVAEGVYVD